MRKLLNLTGILSVMALGAAGCGPSFDNVQSCEDWLEAVSCGEYDFSTVVDCSIYEETTCDVSDYFDCLTDNTTCDEATGVPDTSGWTECTSLAQCE